MWISHRPAACHETVVSSTTACCRHLARGMRAGISTGRMTRPGPGLAARGRRERAGERERRQPALAATTKAPLRLGDGGPPLCRLSEPGGPAFDGVRGTDSGRRVRRGGRQSGKRAVMLRTGVRRRRRAAPRVSESASPRPPAGPCRAWPAAGDCICRCLGQPTRLPVHLKPLQGARGCSGPHAGDGKRRPAAPAWGWACATRTPRNLWQRRHAAGEARTDTDTRVQGTLDSSTRMPRLAF